MKLQKLVLSVATSGLLLGASGAALAKDSTCQLGFINNETVDNITVTDKNCLISETQVNGNVTVTNSNTFVMNNSRVVGSISMTGDGDEQTLIYNVDVYNNLTSKGGGGIWFFNNQIFAPGGGTRSASFEGFTDEVNIFNNLVEGDLLCVNNNFVATSGNVVYGQDTCEQQ